jgi:predicted nuclease of predicted toxin-antitoxin system
VRILIDMNLSPKWVEALQAAGHESRHWGGVGAGNAEDNELMRWAAANGYIVLTNDLDFSARPGFDLRANWTGWSRAK